MLDPDSARPKADDSDDTLREVVLTLAHLSSRYLGEDYPYRNTGIQKDKSIGSFADILCHAALVIYRLAAELSETESDLIKTELQIWNSFGEMAVPN